MKVYLYLAIFLCGYVITTAFPDTTGYGIKKNLKLNYDSHNDTLILVKSSKHNLLPQGIKWGNSSNKTTFKYPNWNKINGSINIDDFNKDTVPDLHITIWGRLVDTNNVVTDTIASIVLFGQYGLDTLSQIDLSASLDSNQLKFVFVKLVRGTHLVDEAVRDYSYSFSYRLPDINQSMPPAPILSSVDNEKIDAELNVSPNPTTNSLMLQLETSLTGKATLKILDLKGQVFENMNVNIEDFTKTPYMLLLNNYPNGTYIVTLESQNNKFRLFKKFTIIK